MLRSLQHLVKIQKSCHVSTSGLFHRSSLRTPSWLSASTQVTQRQDLKTSDGKEKGKTSLVIFDKDGTLICFHSMWSPWARRLAQKLEDASGRSVADKVFNVLGYCDKTKAVLPGLLAESPQFVIQDEIVKMFIQEGFTIEAARKMVVENWDEGDTKNPTFLRSLGDLNTLFKILKTNGIKVAVCTSDSRRGTLRSLKHLGVHHYIDMIVCGDDAGTQPKPNAHNAQMICDVLGVSPDETAMVGDTQADVGMGKAANLGKNIGVLSGVCLPEHLSPDASHIVPTVSDILPILLPAEVWKDCYTFSPYERLLVEPLSLEAATTDLQNGYTKKVSLVIFDLYGTLICAHSRWSPWVEKVSNRIAEETNSDIGKKVYKYLGFSQATQRVQNGVLGQGTMGDVEGKIAELLKSEGYSHDEAIMIMNRVVKECQQDIDKNIKTFDNLKNLFQVLKKSDVKVAVCTSESREECHKMLTVLGARKYVDILVCGDDPNTHPKPSPHNTLMICSELNIDPSSTIVVGDSVGDVIMGKEANVKASIGVLSGVSSETDLKPHADHIVPSIKDISDHVLERTFKTTASFPGGTLLKESGGTSQARLYHTLNSQPRRYFSSTSGMRPDAVEYDYVIVGAGSAGCVLANRLSADPNNRVLSLEAGPKDDSWKIHMPSALMYNLCDDKYNWYYHTEPEPGIGGRRMYWPRGRVWGGSSSLNAMVYIRGHAYDFDRWEREGAEGWSYADCLPYFKKAQTHELGPDTYRGGSGPLHVSRGKTGNPLYAAFIEAGIQAGYPFTDDMNGYQQEGVGWMDMTVHKGRRWSASSAYLRPALYRPNLDAECNAFTNRILFEGSRAVGLEYEQKGQVRHVRANKEVILCGGSINSPQLLTLSGIGNADELKQLDIPVIANLQGVGQNLQDHLEIYVQQKCKKPITLYSAQWKFPHNMISIGLEWFTKSTGLGATSHLESGGFVRGNDQIDHPNIQFHFLPSVVVDHGRKLGDCHAYQVHAGTLRPTSKGFLKIRSKNPREHPMIVANYLSTEFDKREMRESIKVSREIFAQQAFDEFRGDPMQPPDSVQTDAELDSYVRDHAETAYHPSCTCKMGKSSDPMAVVNNAARVFGVEGLRVVDASIMPSISSGNLNAPVIMLAEKAADAILGKPPLPKDHAPVWQDNLKRQAVTAASN